MLNSVDDLVEVLVEVVELDELVVERYRVVVFELADGPGCLRRLLLLQLIDLRPDVVPAFVHNNRHDGLWKRIVDVLEFYPAANCLERLETREVREKDV